MTRRRSRERFHQPSLVPLADMLTNTVGIILFILIFTVLATAGVIDDPGDQTGLPMEHKTEATALHFLCTKNLLLPVDETLQKTFLEPLGKPTSYDEVDEWVKKFNAHRVESEYFIVQGEGEAHYTNLGFQQRASLELSLKFKPREGKGETSADLKLASARFLEILKKHAPEERFVYFIVHPDSIEIFKAARALAMEKHFATGWMPLPAEVSLSFVVAGGGGGGGIEPTPGTKGQDKRKG